MRTVEAALREAFELPEEPWRAGRAVPFERELTLGLAALPALPAVARAREVAAWLDAGSAR